MPAKSQIETPLLLEYLRTYNLSSSIPCIYICVIQNNLPNTHKEHVHYKTWTRTEYLQLFQRFASR